MFRSCRIAILFACVAMLAPGVLAQESKAAKSTREKLKQEIAEIDLKEIGTKAFFEAVNQELDKSINIKIDNTSGISNNTKLSYKAKNITVEKLLNEVSDKYEFGWVVISNVENNKIDGWVIIRKSDKGKERGYEFGKGPKGEKQSSLNHPRQNFVIVSTNSASFSNIGRWPQSLMIFSSAPAMCFWYSAP
jgi:hypothetical protein